MIFELIYLAWKVVMGLSVAQSKAARFHLDTAEKLSNKMDAHIRAEADAEVYEKDVPMRSARRGEPKP